MVGVGRFHRAVVDARRRRPRRARACGLSAEQVGRRAVEVAGSPSMTMCSSRFEAVPARRTRRRAGPGSASRSLRLGLRLGRAGNPGGCGACARARSPVPGAYRHASGRAAPARASIAGVGYLEVTGIDLRDDSRPAVGLRPTAPAPRDGHQRQPAGPSAASARSLRDRRRCRFERVQGLSTSQPTPVGAVSRCVT